MSHSLFGDGVEFYNVAHRGFSAIAPENTMVAFEKGMEAGANMLEMDVMMTGDGQVIVFHDYRLGRTTNGNGLVKRSNFNHIRMLDAGTWFSHKYKEERVPLLDEVLEMAKNRIRLNIEMKHRRHNGVYALVDKCLRIVEHRRMGDDVIFSSFNLEALRYLHYKAPHLRFAPLYRHNFNPTPRSFPLQYGAQGIVLNHLFLNRTTVQQFHNLGIKVFVYTVNGLRKIEKTIRLGVDGVISDNPAAVASVTRRIIG
ncbi:MAG TPA: glycerophosphodiester phosphodiesterase family protein [Candidatus Acidoferrales bacterium]|nr:glycerophosphodiester phosphodiesterase family protein [Candidatus Acidoferrales bacterium]